MNQATQFLKEAYSELRQSTWLTREQALDSTKAVFLLVALMAVYVGAIDFVLSTFIKAVMGR
jgi:preprotein translocase SecE subunit